MLLRLCAKTLNNVINKSKKLKLGALGRGGRSNMTWITILKKHALHMTTNKNKWRRIYVNDN